MYTIVCAEAISSDALCGASSRSSEIFREGVRGRSTQRRQNRRPIESNELPSPSTRKSDRQPLADAISGLVAIRQAIVEDSRRWLRVRNDKTMRADFHFAGESLKTAPRGYAKDHPRIEDLRRKDFLIVSPLEESTVTSAGLIPAVLAKIKAARPWMRFLCLAARVPF